MTLVFEAQDFIDIKDTNKSILSFIDSRKKFSLDSTHIGWGTFNFIGVCRDDITEPGDEQPYMLTRGIHDNIP